MPDPAQPPASGDLQTRPHQPVLLERCLAELALEPGAPPAAGWWIDGTFGAGGHSRAMLARGACVALTVGSRTR